MTATSHTSGGYVLDTPAASGLTKRELFAAMAMQGLCACSAKPDGNEHTLTKAAVAFADSLIAALSDDRSNTCSP